MTTRTLAVLIVVGALLIGAMVAAATTATPTNGDAAPEAAPSCPEHGKSGPCAKLNSEQREQVHAQIRQMRDAGASREEIRAAMKETLKSFGVEAPKADCGAKRAGAISRRAGCGHDTVACGKVRVGCGDMVAGCGEVKRGCGHDRAACGELKAGCSEDKACCGADKDAEGNCEKKCERRCCSEGGDASTSEPAAE